MDARTLDDLGNGGVASAHTSRGDVKRLGAVAFWTRAIDILDFSDLMQGLTKPIIFGFIIATVGCYQGLAVRGGTQGVGRATTQAVVSASVFILVSNFFLTKLMLFLAGNIF